jgi:hypothetical protein
MPEASNINGNINGNVNENGRSAVASYVASLSADLAGMARKTGLETLGYLLEMVRLEAESVTRNNATTTTGKR